jgi:peptidoglycan/LPS O-acetylase OafA/YrhL
LEHVAGLDGLRALAVAAVLAYHGDVPGFGGGFLGVSVFFTLSGFLVTRLLVHEWLARGSIDLRRFWSRRFRRLLPASWTLVAAVVAVGLIGLWTDGQLRSLGGDVVFAVAELFNWHLIAEGASYGSSASAPSPLQHFWSLAVEQQFYLLLPLVLLAVVAVLLRWGAKAEASAGPPARHHRMAVLRRLGIVLLALAVGSAAANWWWAQTSVDRAYLGTDTRAAEMLVGAVLAVVTLRFGPVFARFGRGMRTLLAGGAAAVLAVLVVSASVDAGWLYPWGLLGTSLCTAVVLSACLQPGGTTRFLSLRPLVALGVISYGVYLVHWPVFLLIDERSSGLGGPALFAVRVVVSVVLAAVSFSLLERPVRTGRLVSTRTAMRAVPSVAAVLVVVALVGASTAPPEPDYLRAAAEGPVEVIEPDAPRARIPTPPADATTSGEQTSGEQTPGEQLSSDQPSPEAPPVPAAASEAPPATVPAPPPRHAGRVLFVGDSIANSVEDSLADVVLSFGVAFAGASAPGCGVITGFPTDESGRVADMTRPCHDAVPRRQLEAVRAAEPDLVVAMSSWEMTNRQVDDVWYPFGSVESDSMLEQLYRQAVDRLAAGGAVVALVLLPDVVDGREQRAEAIEVQRGRHLNDLMQRVADADPRVVTVDLAGRVCPADPCPTAVEGVELRAVDGRHFDDPGAARMVAQWLASEILAIDLDSPGD